MRPTFSYPFAGMYPVSSPYGPRGDSFHTGTDFAVPSGTAILSSNAGQVVYVAYEAGGAGNTVTVAGADGWQSRYHHLQAWCVSVGQHVAPGDTLGWCDSTGASSGPHLHFEIRPTASTTTDPIPILEADAGDSGYTPGDEPAPDTFTDQEDTLLLIERGTSKICVIVGNHRPRLIESVNDYQNGPFLICDHATFEQYFADAIKLYEAAIA
jgi:hypothetical protein